MVKSNIDLNINLFKATISKLYNKLNQLQMKINTQQLTQSNLEHELEEKTQQIERQGIANKLLSPENPRIYVV